MSALKSAVGIGWIVFFVYWLAAAFGAKQGARNGRRFLFLGLAAVPVILLVRAFDDGSLAVHSTVLGAIGVALFACGIALAVWARIYLGRNWGMPMTQKAEPELVTSGPYRFVRHPIYSGLLLALLGTALVTNLLGLIVVLVLCGYFYLSASVEEKNLTATFPSAYPAYRAHTKMLISHLL